MSLENHISKGIRLPDKNINQKYGEYDIYAKDTERLLIKYHADHSKQLCYRYYISEVQDNLSEEFNDKLCSEYKR